MKSGTGPIPSCICILANQTGENRSWPPKRIPDQVGIQAQAQHSSSQCINSSNGCFSMCKYKFARLVALHRDILQPPKVAQRPFPWPEQTHTEPTPEPFFLMGLTSASPPCSAHPQVPPWSCQSCQALQEVWAGRSQRSCCM